MEHKEIEELLKKDFCLYPSQCGIGMDCSKCYEGENKALRSAIKFLLQELDQYHSQLGTYKKAMDDIYNHNEAARSAVIQYFGIHHLPLGE